MKMIPETYVEVAIYQIRSDDPAAWKKARQTMVETLRQYPGFHSMETLQSLENPNLLVDYVRWTDSALAKQAAVMAMKDPPMVEAFAFISKMEFFHHFKEYKA